MRSLMVEGSPTDGGLAGYLRKGIKNAPTKMAPAREMLRLKSLPAARRSRKERVADTEHPTYSHPEESRGEKQAGLLGRAGEDLLVVGACRRLLECYRPIEDRLPDEEGEEAGEEAGEQPGGHAAAQVGRDHRWP